MVIRQEILKDAYLVENGYEVEWHFYWSEVSNTGGLSAPLRRELVNAGIRIVEHYTK